MRHKQTNGTDATNKLVKKTLVGRIYNDYLRQYFTGTVHATNFYGVRKPFREKNIPNYFEVLVWRAVTGIR